MEAAWRHTDTLIFQSRYQEILLLVQDDPLEDLMRVSMQGGVGGCGDKGGIMLPVSSRFFSRVLFVEPLSSYWKGGALVYTVVVDSSL